MEHANSNTTRSKQCLLWLRLWSQYSHMLCVGCATRLIATPSPGPVPTGRLSVRPSIPHPSRLTLPDPAAPRLCIFSSAPPREAETSRCTCLHRLLQVALSPTNLRTPSVALSSLRTVEGLEAVRTVGMATGSTQIKDRQAHVTTPRPL